MEVTLCNNEKEFIIKISDQGGGISDNQMKDILKYSFSTSQREEQAEYVSDVSGGSLVHNDRSTSRNMLNGTLSGYGFGLPSSLAYAKFLGGSLEIVSMYGLGTDVFVRISHITRENTFGV